MQRQTYESMTDALRVRPCLAKATIAANKAITYAIYLAYPSLICWLVFTSCASGFANEHQTALLLKAVLVPALGFALLSVFRKAVNAPRPYEVFDLPPVMPKSTKGKSFPSRHVFSIFVIGVAFAACCPIGWAGPAILVLGVLLAGIRVVTGVHFPKDVIAGAMFALLWGAIGFYAL